MSLFSKDNTFCGLDLGSTRLRLAQMAFDKHAKPELIAVGMIDTRPDLFWQENLDPQLEQQAIDTIKQLIKQVGLKTKQVVIGLPEDKAFSRIIEMPAMSRHELENNIIFEAESYIPYQINEAQISWDIIENSPEDAPTTENKKSPTEPARSPTPNSPSPTSASPTANLQNTLTDNLSQLNNSQTSTNNDSNPTPTSKANPNQEVFLTAAPTDMLEKTIKILEKAGLKTIAVETDSLAQVRSIAPQNFGACQAIIDIGHLNTQLIITWHGIPRLTKNIPIGSLHITQAIAKDLSINLAEAEKLKLGLMRLQPEQQQNVIKAYAPTLQSISSDIKRTVIYYGQQHPTQPIKEILINGRGAMLFGLNTFLQNSTGQNVNYADCWNTVNTTNSLSSDQIKQLAGEYAIAVGLALRQE